MATKWLIAYNPITFESFVRHATKHREPDASQYDMGYIDACDQIDDWMDANTVDAVEVVRCKDCKWYEIAPIDNVPYCSHESGYCGEYMGGLFFCACGERKTDG